MMEPMKVSTEIVSTLQRQHCTVLLVFLEKRRLREACDLGMFAQNFMLGLAANGLGSCPQTALGLMANTIKPKLGIGDDQILLWGLSFGYPDWDDPVNGAITERAPLESFLTWHS